VNERPSLYEDGLSFHQKGVDMGTSIRTFFISLVCLFFVVSCFIGCSSSSGTDSSRRYSSTIGTATARDFRAIIQQVVIRKYRYQIENARETGDIISYETKWEERAPFRDEEEKGIRLARTRLIVEARTRTRGGLEASGLYSVRFIGENQYQFIDSDVWVTESLTDSGLTYLREISRELEREFRSGLHQF